MRVFERPLAHDMHPAWKALWKKKKTNPRILILVCLMHALIGPISLIRETFNPSRLVSELDLEEIFDKAS